MKFKCPKCGTLIEGQPERCPSCGVKFKWKKPEEVKPNPEKPVSPAPTAKPRGDIALMMVVKPAMAKYRELYPEDVIDDEEVKKIIVENVEHDTDEVLSEIHETVLRREQEKAEAEEAALREAEEAKQKELTDKKRPYYRHGMVAAIVTLVFAPSAFMLGSALVTTMSANSINSWLINFLFLAVILASIVMFVLSIVRFARCMGSIRAGDFDHFVERIENKKKPKLPVHLIFSIIDFTLLLALMVTAFVTLNNLEMLSFRWFIIMIICFLAFAVVPFVLGLVFYGQQRKRIQ